MCPQTVSHIKQTNTHNTHRKKNFHFGVALNPLTVVFCWWQSRDSKWNCEHWFPNISSKTQTLYILHTLREKHKTSFVHFLCNCCLSQFTTVFLLLFSFFFFGISSPLILILFHIECDCCYGIVYFSTVKVCIYPIDISKLCPKFQVKHKVLWNSSVNQM